MKAVIFILFVVIVFASCYSIQKIVYYRKPTGQWTKELIWINDFQKDGYTRRAGKIIHEQ